jgi:hypothetical protein
MQKHNITPNSLSTKDRHKDTNLNTIKPIFELINTVLVLMILKPKLNSF